MALQRLDHGAVVAAAHGLETQQPLAERGPEVPGRQPGLRLLRRRDAIQVHHRWPFHDCVLAGRPDLELDPRNLIALCETERGVATLDCHLHVGHMGDWKSYNPRVAGDAHICRASPAAKRLALIHQIWSCAGPPQVLHGHDEARAGGLPRALNRAFPRA